MKAQLKSGRMMVAFACAGLGVLLLVLMLHSTQSQVQAGAIQIPAQKSSGWITVLTDTFDGSAVGVPRTIASNGGYMWGRVITPSQDLTDTLWCVQGGLGASLRAGIDTYTDNMSTTVTYGPLNLKARQAELAFSYWISTAAGDGLKWGYSTDGTVFTYTAVTPATMAEWHTMVLDHALDNALGSGTVYLRFLFYSDNDGQVSQGVFLDNVQIRVTEEITASFSASTPGCLGNSTAFNSTSAATSGIALVEWAFEQGSYGTGNTAQHTFSRAGTHTVWMTATSTLGSKDVVSMPVSIEYVQAKIDVVPLHSGDVICRDVQTTFSDASIVTGTFASRLWHFDDDNSTATTYSVFHTFSTLGWQRVTLNVATSAGCVDVGTVDLNVVEPPTAQLIANTGQTETGATNYFTDTGSGATTWVWDFDDGVVVTTTQPSVKHVYTMGGPKTIVLTAIAGSGCASVSSVSLQVTAKVYLPLSYRSRFFGYRYSDDFSSWSSGWPGGSHITRNPDGTASDDFYFGYKTASPAPNGNYRSDGRIYHIRAHDDGDHVFVTGPQKKAFVLQNFVYQSAARTVSGKRRGDEYGILISPVPLDPANPNSHGQPVYTLQMRLLKDTRNWVFKKWTIANTHNHPATELAKGTTRTHLTLRTGWFNAFKFERVGNTLYCYIHGAESWGKWKRIASRDLTKDFAKVPDKFYVGFYVAHTKPYSYDFEAQFDNVKAISTPR